MGLRVADPRLAAAGGGLSGPQAPVAAVVSCVFLDVGDSADEGGCFRLKEVHHGWGCLAAESALLAAGLFQFPSAVLLRFRGRC